MRRYAFTVAEHTDASVSELNEAAWVLGTYEPLALGEPECVSGRAMRARGRIVRHQRSALSNLDALAQHKSRDTAAAVETQERAISLMPSPDADPGMADRLAEYEAALSGRGEATKEGER